MKKWALIVVAIYMLALFLISLPFILAALTGKESAGRIAEIWCRLDFQLWMWAWVVLMGLAQAALLVIPVRLAAARPVTRRWIVWPIITSVILLLMMAAGIFFAVGETLQNTKGISGDCVATVFFVIGAIWLIWTFLFGFYTGNRPPHTLISRIVKFLIAGSILELLVAIPTHVIARMSNYCCAGFMTFIGLSVGLSVMLLAFGPAVFALFVRRYASIRKNP